MSSSLCLASHKSSGDQHSDKSDKSESNVSDGKSDRSEKSERSTISRRQGPKNMITSPRNVCDLLLEIDFFSYQ
jgi:hypothetical protein